MPSFMENVLVSALGPGRSCLDAPPREAALEQLREARCASLTLGPQTSDLADDGEMLAAIRQAARSGGLTELNLGANDVYAAAPMPLAALTPSQLRLADAVAECLCSRLAAGETTGCAASSRH